jgi:hypothetical protein
MVTRNNIEWGLNIKSDGVLHPISICWFAIGKHRLCSPTTVFLAQTLSRNPSCGAYDSGLAQPSAAPIPYVAQDLSISL